MTQFILIILSLTATTIVTGDSAPAYIPIELQFQAGNFALLRAAAYSRASTNKRTQLTSISHAEKRITAISSSKDTMFFASNDGYLYSYSPETYKRKKIAFVKMNDFSTSMLLNDKLYFGSSDNYLYEYDPNEEDEYKEEEERLRTLTQVKSAVSGITSLNNRIYFGTYDGNLYEYNLLTNQNIHIAKLKAPIFHIQALSANKKIYIGTQNNKLNEFNTVTNEVNELNAPTSGYIPMTTLDDKVYFGSNNDHLYQYNPKTNEAVIVCTVPAHSNIRVLLPEHNLIYIGLSNSSSLWKFNPADNKCGAVAALRSEVYSMAAVNNKFYFGCRDAQLYEYYEEADIEGLLLVTSLQELASNDDRMILSAVSRLNPEIDVSLLEITNKKSTSALISARNYNNRYFGSVEVYFTVKKTGTQSIDKPFLNLDGIIKEAVFIAYKNEYGYNPKEVTEVTTDYLTYSDVKATEVSNSLKSTKVNETICFGTLILENHHDLQNDMQVPNCKYLREIGVTTEITKGLSTSQILPGNCWGDLLGAWPFDSVDSRICPGKGVRVDESVILSETWPSNMSNAKADRCKESSEINIPSDTVPIPPRSVVSVTALQEIETQQVTLNLEQEIRGHVFASILNQFNEKVAYKYSFVELMEHLLNEDLLPKEITINDDFDEGSAIFCGTMIRTMKRDSAAIINVTKME